MDAEDESTAYLKLFNEGPHNYLLHSSEDGLNDAFPVEPIFTEIASDWSSEGFPILLSGPLTADENNDSESNVQLLAEDNESSSQNEDSTFYDKNRLVLSNYVEENEVEKTVTHVINGDAYSITYTQDSQEEVAESEENVEVIQLLNIDGTVTTINKNLFNVVDKEKSFENFYTQVQANKCKLCSFLCESVEDITAHINLKHGKEVQVPQTNGVLPPNGTKMTSILNVNKDRKKYTLYICSDCGSGYSNKEDLKQHMITQHKMVQATSAAPTSPDKVPPDKPDVEIPEKRSSRAISASLLKKQKSLRKIKCSIKGCPLRFDKEESRKRHEDCHVDQHKKQFMCPVCKSKFSIWRICSTHMWKCHSIDLGLLTCPMCNEFKSYSSVRVMNHMAIHNEEKPFVCTSCGKAFKQLNQLRNHEIIHKAPDEVPDSFTTKQCEFCDRFFANSKCLKKHIKFVHDKFKPFICNICGHQTARKEMLQLHHRQHTGDKPFHCSYCEYKTGDRNCLRKHTMRHFGAAKYSCPYCDYQSIQTSAYKIHLANKHPGKEGTYACTLCKYTTINCSSYLAHVKCHELEKKKKQKVEKRPVEDNESKSSDETQNFLNTEHSEEAVDTGGITIPATFDLQLNDQNSLI
ncbi:oocyte zinc finger protein XlCOF6 [Tribolium castaneum]|uniref:Zinc finger protein 304-like Protein n=1 Tax=Tribolium castaneum TaxID=7070 RepID=D6WEU1_TRICA|nr:PREDICTED: oocyte zinc finger protein XlCOF6 [Tribolium castaneum]XP_008190592.1 PREDICTED: oocyte zinc finger protein XlCOF6 [Tribolium castaneum]XP_008190593.1 PREDICTED: oocyte zinc finger protein XlCOF6 [Tribolium castaneum]XP_015832959.1 PREDICTED: oocyte zinc finger protein XlCOF6 [Tribolium castaneum]EFA00438.1 Zinc finger protein 304-like Protein [Tribolium castaneum]|eukprot:XP_001814285.1 PREDICTED: oocyte zinc finger protein XlCOF6 [Tribolium castaneum]